LLKAVYKQQPRGVRTPGAELIGLSSVFDDENDCSVSFIVYRDDMWINQVDNMLLRVAACPVRVSDVMDGHVRSM
jgi:hypothetical protein